MGILNLGMLVQVWLVVIVCSIAFIVGAFVFVTEHKKRMVQCSSGFFEAVAYEDDVRYRNLFAIFVTIFSAALLGIVFDFRALLEFQNSLMTNRAFEGITFFVFHPIFSFVAVSVVVCGTMLIAKTIYARRLIYVRMAPAFMLSLCSVGAVFCFSSFLTSMPVEKTTRLLQEFIFVFLPVVMIGTTLFFRILKKMANN